ncbi:MAG: MmcQ/YjbR family DNA-binding protein [Bauldia sp.]|nr:MmcQ/YjbR family DNA-binding protein [Bauldia sp.]
MPTQSPDLDEEFAPVRALVDELALPGVTEAPSYGTPGLKVKGKFLARLREPDVLVVVCPLDEKEFLLEADPEVFFETPHYKGWPAILVRLSRIEPQNLKQLIERAWRVQAPKRVLAAFDAEHGGKGAAKG